MINRFDGSYILAIASYNAGPSAAKRWVRQFGDPREPGVDVIDWVESIPYRETRNYVQRVIENLRFTEHDWVARSLQKQSSATCSAAPPIARPCSRS